MATQPHTKSRSALLALPLIALATALAACGESGGGQSGGGGSTTVEQAAGGAEYTFSDPATIDNPYAPLTEFERCELRGQSEGERERVVRTLLDRTEPFEYAGETVEVAVIEDRAFIGGELVERTLDYFAQSDDGTVHYFGEDVDNYENGKLVDHHGSFRYGEDTDFLGVLMPGDPQVGDEWKFENAPPITVESDRMVGRLDSVEVRGTTYEDVIRIREDIQPDDEIEFKLYAAGYGVIQELPPDGKVELVSCS